jgi:hypothetical protein
MMGQVAVENERTPSRFIWASVVFGLHAATERQELLFRVLIVFEWDGGLGLRDSEKQFALSTAMLERRNNYKLLSWEPSKSSVLLSIIITPTVVTRDKRL